MFMGSEPPKYLVITKYIFNQILFTFFFNFSKSVLTEKFFVDWPIRNLFSQQKVSIKKLTADIWLKKYLVIHEILVVRIPRTCYYFVARKSRSLQLWEKYQYEQRIGIRWVFRAKNSHTYTNSQFRINFMQRPR